MAKTSTYLNFPNQTEEAFHFYKSAFGTEFTPPGFRRFSDIPPMEGQPPMPDAVRNLVMHVELPITGGHILMGTDAPAEMGFKVVVGNNVNINLEPDTREEADRLFKALSAGGSVEMPMQEQFWGAYFGSCTDKYGIRWMVNCYGK
ncbi:MAG: VOC family protein [Chitinophagaceae bacterium]|jgi:PhnB protein|nr:VOC family protein [Chitinophagaceae bacterium]